MAEQSAIRSIGDITKLWAFKYRVPELDMLLYLEHAYDCYRSLNLYSGRIIKETKLTTNNLGVQTLPVDCIDVIGPYIPWQGRKWFFRHVKDWVTTQTSGAYDTSYGEGAPYTQDMAYGYGAHGGLNDYRYNINWDDRTITIDGFLNEQFTLAYISTGIHTDATTSAPVDSIPVFDTYLTWKKSEIDRKSINERRDKERLYLDALRMFRLRNRPSFKEFRDKWLENTIQAPSR